VTIKTKRVTQNSAKVKYKKARVARRRSKHPPLLRARVRSSESEPRRVRQRSHGGVATSNGSSREAMIDESTCGHPKVRRRMYIPPLVTNAALARTHARMRACITSRSSTPCHTTSRSNKCAPEIIMHAVCTCRRVGAYHQRVGCAFGSCDWCARLSVRGKYRIFTHATAQSGDTCDVGWRTRIRSDPQSKCCVQLGVHLHALPCGHVRVLYVLLRDDSMWPVLALIGVHSWMCASGLEYGRWRVSVTLDHGRERRERRSSLGLHQWYV
jgi:hypothetical protein